MSAVLLGLGSNLFDREAHLRAGLAALAGTPGFRFRSASGLFETEPVGGPPQGPYLNACAIFDVGLPPEAVLERLHAVEAAEGRLRAERNAPRSLDLDLLLQGDTVLADDVIQVPHPRLAERSFVLAPACEIASDWVHPLLGVTLDALERRLRPHPGVRRLAASWSLP